MRDSLLLNMFWCSLFFFMLFVSSCSAQNDGSQDIIADKIKLVSIKKINSTLSNSCYYENKSHSGQGMAIYGNKMYRLFNSGLCREFDISDPKNPLLISTFKMGSYGKDNHCNCAQIDIANDGSAYIYISSVRELNGLRGKCFVEKISSESTKLVQTISVGDIHFLSNYKGLNIICGDDGFLWLFGYDVKGNNMIYVKASKPSLNYPDVVIEEKDIIDFWIDNDYSYNSSVTQGGTVHNGYLYSVFGTSRTNRHIAVYDVISHRKVADVDLNPIVQEEPEDCDFYGDNLILAIYGGEGYYALSLTINEYKEY